MRSTVEVLTKSVQVARGSVVLKGQTLVRLNSGVEEASLASALLRHRGEPGPLFDSQGRVGARKIPPALGDKVVNSASGTFGVRLELPNPNGSILTGVKCSVNFCGPSATQNQQHTRQPGSIPATATHAAVPFHPIPPDWLSP